MGRFERDIKKKIDSEAEKLGPKACNFEEWSKDNRASLAGFTQEDNAVRGGVKVGVKTIPLVCVLAAVFIICAVLIALFAFGGDDNGRVSTDGADSDLAAARELTAEEYAAIVSEFTFIGTGYSDEEQPNESGAAYGIMYLEDNSPALAEIKSQFVYDGAEYGFTFRTDCGADYNFSGKDKYACLAKNTKVGDYTVSYGVAEAEGGGYVSLYLISRGASSAYMEVGGGEETFDAVINFIASGDDEED